MLALFIVLGIICAPALIVAAIIAGKWLMEPSPTWWLWWAIGGVLGLLLLTTVNH